MLRHVAVALVALGLGTARAYARLAGMGFAAVPWPRGTAPNWQNHRFAGAASFVVELPTGRLSAAAVERHVHAILMLGQ